VFDERSRALRVRACVVSWAVESLRMLALIYLALAIYLGDSLPAVLRVCIYSAPLGGCRSRRAANWLMVYLSCCLAFAPVQAADLK
jgi:hypothetical protein